jgi:hypothetical protein
VVFIGFLSDKTTLISVDSFGVVGVLMRHDMVAVI